MYPTLFVGLGGTGTGGRAQNTDQELKQNTVAQVTQGLGNHSISNFSKARELTSKR